jgi:hypothetical protein
MRFVDGQDWAGWRSLMADDMVFGPSDPESKDPMRIEGADALVAVISEALKDVATVHMGFMPEIEILSADQARGVWAMEDILRWKDGRVLKGYGYYRETYVRQGGAWKFKTVEVLRKSEETYGLTTGRVLP